jgi:hypothetical protein
MSNSRGPPVKRLRQSLLTFSKGDLGEFINTPGRQSELGVLWKLWGMTKCFSGMRIASQVGEPLSIPNPDAITQNFRKFVCFALDTDMHKIKLIK